MYKNKKIVVVMPAYNAEKTLRQAFDEVVEQGIVDIVIIVDDCSRDNTVALARSLGEERSSKVLKFESSKVGGVRTGGSERSTLNAQRLTSNEEITPDTNALTHYRTNALHIVLLGLAVAWVAGFAWGRPWLMAHIGNSAYPALEVLLCVLAFAGLPYVLLSANSTLIQAWVAGNARIRECANAGETPRQGEADPRREEKCANAGMRECGNEGTNALTNYRTNEPSSDVYRLYAVSNAGSLLGLLCYPFLVEPFLSLDAQWYGFAGCLALYAGLLAVLAKGLGGRAARSDKSDRSDGSDGTGGTEGTEGTENTNALTNYRTNELLLWLALPATSTFLLNAVTAHLSTDVTPIPLLWVALLAAFLVSYIIGFSKIGEKGVLVWCVVAMVPLLFCAYAMGLKGEVAKGFMYSLIPGILLLLLGCTFLHSWLYSIRPEEGRLTRFYLCLAAGGAAGGLLSGIVAPLIFDSVMEYPIILATFAVLGVLYVRQNISKELRWVETAVILVVLASIILIISSLYRNKAHVTMLKKSRNFYGCLRVSQYESKSQFGDSVYAHRLQHGETLHGIQFQTHYLREKPSAYFGPVGGGLSITSHPSYTNNTPMSVGIIGLGIGTLATYGRTNDTYRFFEINPQVVDVAWNTNYFTYLSGCKADISVALGDARKVIMTETNRYDVFVIDAYSGDSIPFHLATKEAFQLYLSRLKPGGILAVHISNWHIDLNPLCKAVAKEWGLKITGAISQAQGICSGANWVFLSDRQISIEGLPVRETDWAQVRDIPLPTDERGSLLNLVRYGHRPPEKALEIGEVLKF